MDLRGKKIEEGYTNLVTVEGDSVASSGKLQNGQGTDLGNVAVGGLSFNSADSELKLPAGTTAERPSSPSQGYMRYNTDDGIGVEVYSGIRWVPLGAGLTQLALETAELSVTANDATAINIIPPLEIEYLVIAGGGGGGSDRGGGGGAGGYRSSVSGESSGGGASAESFVELETSTNYTVTIGAGGNGGTNQVAGANGSSSVFNTITSDGGGGGGGLQTFNPARGVGFDGGSGGGAWGPSENTTISGGAGTANQGFDGGDGEYNNNTRNSGGGGGAGEAGNTDGFSDGGDGVASSITGSSVTRAGGGAGNSLSSGGVPGDGGGGTSGTSVNGGNGTTNTGSGGGGGGDFGTRPGGNGGSGVVILRYSSDFTISIGAGLTGSETTVGANKVATITAGTGNVSWT